jgi:hypothetical protein
MIMSKAGKVTVHHKPKLPIRPPQTQPPLEQLEDAARRVVDVACVPVEEYNLCCARVCASLELIWGRDRRVVSQRPGRALLKAADAAMNLNDALGSLNQVDRECVERLLTLEPWALEPWDEWLCDVPKTVWLLAFLFSGAAGGSLPQPLGAAALREKQGRRKGSIKDLMFETFIHHILVHVVEAGGKLTFSKNDGGRGTLIDALNIFRPVLPRGFVPNALPLGTIEKVRTKHSKFHRRQLEISRRAQKAHFD